MTTYEAAVHIAASAMHGWQGEHPIGSPDAVNIKTIRYNDDFADEVARVSYRIAKALAQHSVEDDACSSSDCQSP